VSAPLTDRVGFEHPKHRSPSARRHLAALELFATVALVVCTVVAVTAVSIGIARADALDAAPASDHAFAVAALLGVIFAGWGGITALMAGSVPRRD
jgi:hypothetical protein